MAPRRMLRACRATARGAGLAVGLWLAAGGVASACNPQDWTGAAMVDSVTLGPARQGPVAAWFEGPTTRYPHGVLGDTVEAGALVALIDGPTGCALARIDLPQSDVFEDLAPRMVDLTGDGWAEIVVVHSAVNRGARLAIYGLAPTGDALTLYVATPHIGRTNRWLAPAGIGDLDGDGTPDIAYVDRPHLARTLRVWRFTSTSPANGTLTEIASHPGLTNHRIGEDFITGGLRDCGTGPEIITADASWANVMATRFENGALTARALAPFTPAAVARALSCTL